MRVLIVHPEAEYFAGAEKMLGYFLTGMASAPHEVTVAAVEQSRVRESIPKGMATCWVPSNARFSVRAFAHQVQSIRNQFRTQPFDVIHGWAARDWELTAAVATLARKPALGTLHDHPRAPFISKGRQRLMAWGAALGLRKVVCVSSAVREACLQSGYRSAQLTVVHNGLPPAGPVRLAERAGRFRLGFLGLFSERKGLNGLFTILDELARITPVTWQIALAGDAQDEAGRRLVEELKSRFGAAAWWPLVEWRGWVKRPLEFLTSLDLLICPSSEFDPFPTVLLEAGQAGVPVLGARVGGVAEIIEDGRTGWLFEARAWREAALKLKVVLETPGMAQQAGRHAKKRVEEQFPMAKMVAGYLKVYTDLSRTR